MASAVAYTNGAANGFANGNAAGAPGAAIRFSDVPASLDIPVQDMEDEDEGAVEVDLENLLDDPTELCTLLENEKVSRNFWMTISMAYAKQKKIDTAIEMLNKGMNAIPGPPKDKLSMLTCLCWMYLWKSRAAPRVPAEGSLVGEAKTKEYYLQAANQALTDASRIQPTYTPLFMARGVIQLLKASLQPPSKSSGVSIDQEKSNILKMALKAFDDAIKASQGKNMLAVLGKARTLYSMGKPDQALEFYQRVLQRMPDMKDPDPRIGIGACLWALHHKEDAKAAWERALEVSPDSKTANILLGLYYLDASGQFAANSQEFLELYKKAMTVHAQKAYKLDKDYPLTCATFAGYFLTRKSYQNADALAHKAIQFTDVNAIASDGWYLLARKEHYNENYDLAADYYRRSDDARGGAEHGYLPAKFGVSQLSVLKADFVEAKFRLERIVQSSKSHEAMVLLGTIYAEEVFASQYAVPREDRSVEFKKAVGLLEACRSNWKAGRAPADPSVLLNLARLYEAEQPEKALQCLQQAEELETTRILEVDGEQPPAAEDEEAVRVLRTKVHESLPPQLLNNMGGLYYNAERFEDARQFFQAALNGTVNVGEKQDDVDADALATTISFNLGRTYEAMGMLDDAKTVYEGVLERHADYIDARTRLAYIALKQSPNDEGPKAISKLYQDAPSDFEVRALYGWYLGRISSKKRSSDLAQDPELRHYKHTLQNHDKHDRYALIGMGNIYLQHAREMPRDTEPHRAKRSQMYCKALEFFEKALQLDPKNAYAAQGIAIAMVEEKKEHTKALPLFMQIRETVRDNANVAVNLGHLLTEMRQFGKAIESYEAALEKGKKGDAGILSCLGRVWLARGRAEKDVKCYRRALEYAQMALEAAPEQTHFKFNVAYVQIQLAQTVLNLPEASRTLAELEQAISSLEEAIESLEAVAQAPNPPYPKSSLEGRANMARNTMRKQLERAAQSQKEYEDRNAEKLREAMEIRQKELREKEEAERKKAEEEAEQKRILAEERAKILERDKELAEQRARELAEREEADMTTDSETGERVKRKKRPAAGKRKKKGGDETGDESDLDGSRQGTPQPKKSRRSRKERAGTGETDDEEKPKKKRRLARKESAAAQKAKPKGNFKSAEVVVDSDDEGEDGEQSGGDDGGYGSGRDEHKDDNSPDSPLRNVLDEDEEEGGVGRKARRGARRMIESDDDEDEDMADAADAAPVAEDGGVVSTIGGGEMAVGEVNATSPARDGKDDTPMRDADEGHVTPYREESEGEDR